MGLHGNVFLDIDRQGASFRKNRDVHAQAIASCMISCRATGSDGAMPSAACWPSGLSFFHVLQGQGGRERVSSTSRARRVCETLGKGRTHLR